MSENNLPPLLAAAFEGLTADAQAEHRAKLLRELNAVSDLIRSARAYGLSVPELDDLTHARTGITVGADKFCPCCLRPFAVTEL